jgi:hypothetical protein
MVSSGVNTGSAAQSDGFISLLANGVTVASRPLKWAGAYLTMVRARCKAVDRYSLWRVWGAHPVSVISSGY